MFVPSGRVRRVVHRDGDPLGARTPGEVALFGSWRVARPRVAAVAIAWRLFHRSPRRVAMLLDRARTSLRRRRGTDYSLGSWMNGAQVEWLRDALDALQPEAVLATIIFSAPPIDVLPASARHRVLFAEECFSDRHASFEAQGYRVQPPELGPVAEQRILEQWPLVVAIQREEAVRLAEIAPGTTVVTIAPTRTVRVADAAATIDGRVSFVGSGTTSNVDGLQWLLGEIWPLVLAAYPSATLAVYGSVCARVSCHRPEVTMHGEVRDLDDALGRAAVVTIPLRIGSGLKIKLVDAICLGKAAVTTEVGAQGLGHLVPAPFVCENDPAAFAKAVSDLLSDRALRNELEARTVGAASMFDAAHAYRPLDDYLDGRVDASGDNSGDRRGTTPT